MSAKRNFSFSLEIIMDLEEESPDKNLSYINEIFNDIRIFNQQFQNFHMVEITPMISQELIDGTVKLTSYRYIEDIMKIQNYLGLSFKDLKIYDKAEKFFIKALNKNDKLENTKSNLYLPSRTIIKSNLGYMYKDLGRIIKAETLFSEVLKINK